MSPPLFKKPSLDRNVLKNYKPVSNLSFISKLIEKAVANQFNSYINREGFSSVNQSAYRRLNSTETMLLKIQNYFAASMDSSKGVELKLLDLSTAFYTIDNNILFDCLRDWFGVVYTRSGRWIKSYLTNHKQKVKLGNSISDAVSHLYDFCPGAPPFYPGTPPLFPVSMSPTIHMLVRPKYI